MQLQQHNNHDAVIQDHIETPRQDHNQNQQYNSRRSGGEGKGFMKDHNNPQIKDTPIFAGLHSQNTQSNYKQGSALGQSEGGDYDHSSNKRYKDQYQKQQEDFDQNIEREKEQMGQNRSRFNMNERSFSNSQSDNQPLYKSNASFNNSQIYQPNESSKLLQQVLNVSQGLDNSPPQFDLSIMKSNNQNTLHQSRYSEILAQESVNDLYQQASSNHPHGQNHSIGMMGGLNTSQENKSIIRLQNASKHRRQNSSNSNTNNLNYNPSNRESQNFYQNLQNMNEYDLEEFLKSTNSAVSDYNFLFENIDQQLQNNTQMMAEELQKNMPDYLMNTNSSIEQNLNSRDGNSEEVGQRQSQDTKLQNILITQQHGKNKGSEASNASQDSSFSKSQKDNRDMPRMIMTTSNSISGNNISRAEDKSQDRIPQDNQSYGGGIPIMEQSANNISSQIDITDMSEGEIISIEDTYRETNAACRKSIDSDSFSNQNSSTNPNQFQNSQSYTQNQNNQSINRGNKSMTIIEEEEYEESEILNHAANSTNQNFFSQNSLRMNTLKKSTSSNLNKTGGNYGGHNKNNLTQSNSNMSSGSAQEMKNVMGQGSNMEQDSIRGRNTNNRLDQNLRDSYETFGGGAYLGMNSVPNNKNHQVRDSNISISNKMLEDLQSNTQSPQSEFLTENNQDFIQQDQSRIQNSNQEGQSFNLIHNMHPSMSQIQNMNFNSQSIINNPINNKQNYLNTNYYTEKPGQNNFTTSLSINSKQNHHAKTNSNGNISNVSNKKHGYTNTYSDTNQGPTAAATIDGGEQSRTVTLRSPMQHNTINQTNYSNVSTLTHPNVKELIDEDIALNKQQLNKKKVYQIQNITIEDDDQDEEYIQKQKEQNFVNIQQSTQVNQNLVNNLNAKSANNLLIQDFQHDQNFNSQSQKLLTNLKTNNNSQEQNAGSIEEMLKRYQEKYKKQKQESQKLNQQQQKGFNQVNNNLDEDDEGYYQNKNQNDNEDESESQEIQNQEYVNRSFVVKGKRKSQARSRSKSNNEERQTKVYDQSLQDKIQFEFIDKEENQRLLQDVENLRRLIQHKDRELRVYVKNISELEEFVKITENQKLKLEKQLLTQQLQSDQQIKQLMSTHSKEFKVKLNEVDLMKIKFEEQQQLMDQKMETQRERLKRVEKTVYERVEKEYSQILTEKDHIITDQQAQIMQLEHELRQIKDLQQREKVALEINLEEQRVRERQKLMEEKEDIKYRTYQESDKELKKMKERIEQDYHFKYAQLESKYQQKLKQIESMYKNSQQEFLEDKKSEFQQLKQREMNRFEEEKLINHARTTQIVYEDVSKVLINKNKEEEKQKLERARQKVKEEYEEKQRKLEAQWSMQIAQERKQRSQIELKNAQLEQQLYELQEKLRNMECDKENTQKTANTTSDNKDLVNKLKKLNKTLPFK